MIALPTGPFRVVYADPPWHFRTYSERGEAKSPVQHYACMDLDAICALPVSEVASDDAALFLWVVQPMLPEALRVIAEWGFTYKTVAFCWVKLKGVPAQERLFYAAEDVRLGLGYHTRSGMEQCWLATRGRGYERLAKGEAQVHFEAVREHSRKPEHFATAIERLVGNVPKLEMFARRQRRGWTVFGNQTDRFSAEEATTCAAG